MLRKIGKLELDKEIESLLAAYEIIAPFEIPAKGIFYEAINKDSVKDIYWGDLFTTEPVKKFFLWPSEYFSLEELPPVSQKKRIVLGVRPCEAKGLELLDKIFDADYKDSFYINNRQRTLIIGLVCNQPQKGCFCTSLDGSPVESRGMDVLLFREKESFVVEIISQAGKDIFSSLGKELTSEEDKSWALSKEKLIGNLNKKKIPSLKELDNIFVSDYWGQVSGTCLSCGICTYLCPTCHCFDLVDEARKKLRCYDGCAFSDFTLEASGENPRPSKKERYRQRVYHKFNYFKKNFSENLCVGCGRCIRFCPVKIDISEVVSKAPVSNNL